MTDAEWALYIALFKVLGGYNDEELTNAGPIVHVRAPQPASLRELRVLADWFRRYADRLHERADLLEDQQEWRAREADTTSVYSFIARKVLPGFSRDLAVNAAAIAKLEEPMATLSDAPDSFRQEWIRFNRPAEEARALRARAMRANRQSRQLRDDTEDQRKEHPGGGAPRNVAMETLVEWAWEKGVAATEVQRRLRTAGVYVTRDAVQAAMSRVGRRVSGRTHRAR